MCSCDNSVTVWHPGLMFSALWATIKYCWYVDILPSWRRVSHNSSIDYAEQVSFMVAVTGGSLLCVTHCPVESCSVTVSHPALMWTLHTLSSSHHTHIGHRENSEDRQLSFVIVWQLWQWQRRHCIGIWSSNEDKLTMLLILMRILNKSWHMTNMTCVKLP